MSDIATDEYTKRDRILNALAVYPDRYKMSNVAIAELTDTSGSYIYQLRRAVTDGELSNEDLEEALDDQLLAHYRKQLPAALEDKSIQRRIDDPDETVDPHFDTGAFKEVKTLPDRIETAQETKESSPGTVPATKVRTLRRLMVQYQQDADG